MAIVYDHPLYLNILSPHWSPEKPSGVQSSLYGCLSVSVYLRPSGCPRRFWGIIRASNLI